MDQILDLEDPRGPVEDLAIDGQIEALGLIAPAAGPQIQPASPERAARFVQHMADQAIAVLRDPALSPQQRRQALHGLLISGFEMGTIGRLVLGRYWRVASDEQRIEYLQLFETFLVNVYTERFQRYRNVSLEVVSARPARKTLAIIESRISGPTGRAVRVDWVVRGNPGGERIIDVVVEGISMAVTQRAEFASIIQRNGGKIEGLLAALRQRIA